MKCRVCGNEMELTDVLKNKERDVTTLYKQPHIGKKRDIELYRCKNCTHMQIEWLNPLDYYDDYTLIYEPKYTGDEGRYTKSVIDHYCSLFEQLASYALHTDRLLDIGSGPGILMKYEEKYFSDVLGVEPSHVQYEIATKAGRKVINAYFDRKLDLGGGVFSICKHSGI